MARKFRSRLLAGELLIGTMLTLPSPEIAEMMGLVGFDWLFVDGEHGALGTREMQALAQGAGRDTAVVIRLESDSNTAVKKALDIGATGIIVPQVNSAEQAERAMRRAKYPPLGTRGVGVTRAHGYGLHFADYVAWANEATAVIIQVEHVTAVAAIEEIARVPGIDAVFVGPYDLSASMGKMGQVEDAEVKSAINRVTEVCLAADMRLGIFGLSAEAVRPYIDQGYTLITVGMDMRLLGQAAQNLLALLKA
ncbi:MAG TPA: 2,4-dihydroxyhept-2-ene-1,7-dioic acid aldolase [Anaerolineae bacterium]|nr:2,4-dihydroxyhept-2-ene-1,7-dioic acid aldolase [Anaerolineae bacterium]